MLQSLFLLTWWATTFAVDTAEDFPVVRMSDRETTHFIATGSEVATEVAGLKQQLESELRARRPEEFAFIARVVELVKTGRLPLSLVNGTFLWAREKEPYPYPYFERGLRVRAAAIGVHL